MQYVRNKICMHRTAPPHHYSPVHNLSHYTPVYMYGVSHLHQVVPHHCMFPSNLKSNIRDVFVIALAHSRIHGRLWLNHLTYKDSLIYMSSKRSYILEYSGSNLYRHMGYTARSYMWFTLVSSDKYPASTLNHAATASLHIIFYHSYIWHMESGLFRWNPFGY